MVGWLVGWLVGVQALKVQLGQARQGVGTGSAARGWRGVRGFIIDSLVGWPAGCLLAW